MKEENQQNEALELIAPNEADEFIAWRAAHPVTGIVEWCP